MLRCLITNNPCGTDTWEINTPCRCENCQQYLNDIRHEEVSNFLKRLDEFEELSRKSNINIM